MSYFLTLLFTLLLVVLVLWVFIRIGTPTYRIDPDNVIKLLELVLAGEATESDWDVFVGIPIRYNPELDAIREHCAEISERELIGGDGKHLFTKRGIEELELVLNKLKNKAAE